MPKGKAKSCGGGESGVDFNLRGESQKVREGTRLVKPMRKRKGKSETHLSSVILYLLG